METAAASGKGVNLKQKLLRWNGGSGINWDVV
jgi:hypothetical protein